MVTHRFNAEQKNRLRCTKKMHKSEKSSYGETNMCKNWNRMQNQCSGLGQRL